MIKVFVIENRRLVRAGLCRLLADANDVDIVGESATTKAAIGTLSRTPTDIVLVDMHVPDTGGLEALRRLSRLFPEVNLVATADRVDGPFPAKALSLGARGFVTDGVTGKELLECIRDVYRGRRFIAADVARRLVLGSLQEDRNPIHALSARELSVMVMLAEGRAREDISTILAISPKTVSTYRTRLMRKLEVANDVELAHLSMKHGLVNCQSSTK